MKTAAHTDGYAHCAPWFDELSTLPEQGGRRQRLRRKLIEEHLPLAEHIARRFGGRGEPHDDLVQVARMGLIKAIDRYDPGRGGEFLSFAVPTVMGEVRRYFRDTGWALRVPRRLKELHLTASRASTALAQRLGRAPTARELAEHLEVGIDEVTEALAAGHAYQPDSLDGARSGTEPDSAALTDLLGAEDVEFERAEIHEALRPVLRELPARERAILSMRFFENLTQSKIGERIGLSQMHVSRLLSQTLAELRARLEETARPRPADPEG